MRPRLGSAIADRIAHATADPSRWTHAVGVSGRVCLSATPTSNAIELSRPMVYGVTVADGRLSPWRCNLPPHACLGSPRHRGRRSWRG